jgi:hypothetical protein
MVVVWGGCGGDHHPHRRRLALRRLHLARLSPVALGDGQRRRARSSRGAGRMPKAVVAVVVVVDRRDGGGGPAPDVRIRGEAHQRPRCAHAAAAATATAAAGIGVPLRPRCASSDPAVPRAAVPRRGSPPTAVRGDAPTSTSMRGVPRSITLPRRRSPPRRGSPEPPHRRPRRCASVDFDAGGAAEYRASSSSIPPPERFAVVVAPRFLVVMADDFIWRPRMMGKRHRWGGVIADAEGYVRQSAAAARGGRERRRRTVKAAGGGRGVYGVVMMFFFSACALKMNPLSTTSREGLRHVAIMRSDEDGTILAHNNTRFRLASKKGGNAPRAPDKMRDFY